MEELWKEVKGFNGYLVSNYGNVKSFKRGKEKLLKPKTNKYGYKEVSLWMNGKQKMKRINRLVAEAFIPNPQGLEEVNHKDENKTNDYYENLEWLSHGDNTRYSLSKPVEQILDGVVVKRWGSIEEASKELGISKSNISNVCNKKQGKSHGYTWRFI